jgi:hypothetical protein
VHPILPCSPVALATPSLVMGFTARRRQLLPCSLEARPGLVERVGDTAALLAGIGPRIEAARPAPLRRRVRHAYAAADRANPHIAKIDQPRLAVGIILATAAGEADMPPSKQPATPRQIIDS